MSWKRPRTIGPVAARKGLTIDFGDSVGIVPSGVQFDLHFCQRDGWQMCGYEL